MERFLSSRMKKTLSFILIIAGIILRSNTNNNPTWFIERIFKPIEIGSATIYYAGILPILLIYNGFKGLSESEKYKFFKTTKGRIIGTIIVALFSAQLCGYGVKISKNMSNDLNAIYYNRESNNNMLMFEQDENDNMVITCTIELENCSQQAQEFYIDLLVPKDHKEFVVEEKLQTNEKFILKGKEKERIKAVFLGLANKEFSGFKGGTKHFEFALFNNKQEVKFIEKR